MYRLYVKAFCSILIAKDAGIRDLFRLIANIRKNGGYAAHFIRTEKKKQEPNQGLSDEETTEQDSSVDDESEPGVTDEEYENEDADGEGKTNPPNEDPQVDDEGDDDDVVVEVEKDSNPKKESMSEKVARPVATPQAKPVCAPVVPFNHDDDDDVEFVGGEITGTSTSWKASRQQVLMAELQGLRQQLALKRSSSGFRVLHD